MSKGGLGETAPVLDLVHLRRQTMDDPALLLEVLDLFQRQSARIVARMQAAEAAELPGLAHTLRGAALGVGAGLVAAAAEQLEGGKGSVEAVAKAVQLAREASQRVSAGSGSMRDPTL